MHTSEYSDQAAIVVKRTAPHRWQEVSFVSMATRYTYGSGILVTAHYVRQRNIRHTCVPAWAGECSYSYYAFSCKHGNTNGNKTLTPYILALLFASHNPQHAKNKIINTTVGIVTTFQLSPSQNRTSSDSDHDSSTITASAATLPSGEAISVRNYISLATCGHQQRVFRNSVQVR
jgi:hypothetical protein